MNYKNIEGIILDLDGTIYSNSEYDKHTKKVMYKFVSQEKGWSVEKAKSEFNYIMNEKTKNSEIEALKLLNIGMNLWLDFARENLKPHKFLLYDKELSDMLRLINNRCWIDIATNTPFSIAKNILTILDITDYINYVWCIDNKNLIEYKGKPDYGFYNRLSDSYHTKKNRIAIFGDRDYVDFYGARENGFNNCYLVNSAKNTKSVLKSLFL